MKKFFNIFNFACTDFAYLTDGHPTSSTAAREEFLAVPEGKTLRGLGSRKPFARYYAQTTSRKGFSPLTGIRFAQTHSLSALLKQNLKVSVPLRGLGSRKPCSTNRSGNQLNCFSPLTGIRFAETEGIIKRLSEQIKCFSPLKGIRFAETTRACPELNLIFAVSVPLRGLGSRKPFLLIPSYLFSIVSVPLRGLGSRKLARKLSQLLYQLRVSVPLRGLGSRKLELLGGRKTAS
jgi:hypothetical protein